MSTIHQICLACFHQERRGFTFAGAVPDPTDGARCRRCGVPIEQVIRLEPSELSDEIELAWAGDAIVAREPRWERLRQTILAVIAHQWQFEIVRREDGLIEIPVRDDLGLMLRPVRDNITGQEGVLFAAPVMKPVPARGDATEIRERLATINSDILKAPVLIFGTMRDLFPLAEPTPTIFYRRFVARSNLLDPDHFATMIENAVHIVHIAHQALMTFGPSDAALRFFEHVDVAEPVGDSASGRQWDRDASGLLADLGSVDFEELLTRADALRSTRPARSEVHARLQSWLRALGVDLEAAKSGDSEGYTLRADDVAIDVTIVSDHRDTAVRMASRLGSIAGWTPETARATVEIMRALELGDIHLEARDDSGMDIVLRDTLVGDDLDVYELVRTTEVLVRQTRTLRTHLPSDARARLEALPDGGDLTILLELARKRWSTQTPAAREESVGRQIKETLDALHLRPSMNDDGDFLIPFGKIGVEIRLRVADADASVIVSTQLVGEVGVPDHVLLAKLTELEIDPLLGGFRMVEGGLRFEDVLPGNALDVNELARAIYEVVDTVHRCGDTLRSVAEGDLSTVTERAGAGPKRALRTLVKQYMRGPDARARARVVRAIAMYAGDLSLRALKAAMNDPDEGVVAVAAAGLIAALESRDVPETVEALESIIMDDARCESVRLHALRVYGVAAGDLEPRVDVLDRLVRASHESLAIRERALHALVALGGAKLVVDTLVRLVIDSPHRVSVAALEAMGKLERPDPARLYLAVETATDAEGADSVERAEIYRAIAGLDMPGTVIDLIGETWKDAPELARGFADACASSGGEGLEPLREMLGHERGALREAAYVAIREHHVDALANAVARALADESDAHLRAVAIDVLGTLHIRSRAIERALLDVASQPMLQDAAMATLVSLRDT